MDIYNRKDIANRIGSLRQEIVELEKNYERIENLDLDTCSIQVRDDKDNPLPFVTSKGIHSLAREQQESLIEASKYETRTKIIERLKEMEKFTLDILKSTELKIKKYVN